VRNPGTRCQQCQKPIIDWGLERDTKGSFRHLRPECLDQLTFIAVRASLIPPLNAFPLIRGMLSDVIGVVLPSSATSKKLNSITEPVVTEVLHTQKYTSIIASPAYPSQENKDDENDGDAAGPSSYVSEDSYDDRKRNPVKC